MILHSHQAVKGVHLLGILFHNHLKEQKTLGDQSFQKAHEMILLLSGHHKIMCRRAILRSYRS
uniref:Uncharacterized protein n=1 Tax=Arundo donax TaxID=35708 RepID=A0A0A9E1E7_ARUDO